MSALLWIGIAVCVGAIFAVAFRPTKPTPPQVDLAQYLTDADRAELRGLGAHIDQPRRPTRIALEPASASDSKIRPSQPCPRCGSRCRWTGADYRCIRCGGRFRDRFATAGRR